MKKLNSLLLLLAFLGTCLVMQAQESRSLPFLEINPDIRTAGMGDAYLGKSSGSYLYNNPTSIFDSEDKLYASYSFGLFPSINEQRQMYHATSAGYKFAKRHAIMVGFRYLGGLSIPRMDEYGEKKAIHPMDWSIDFGYAFRINNHLSTYVAGNFIQSYIGKVAYTGGASLGLFYSNEFALGLEDAQYTIGLDARDLGGQLKYGSTGVKSYIPTSIGLGGSVTLPLNENHVLVPAINARYFAMPTNASTIALGAGLEYQLYKLAFLRTGYHVEKNNNYFTLGLGCKIKFINIDAAYSIASQKEYNLLRVGLNIAI